jgi:hypothetical protein
LLRRSLYLERKRYRGPGLGDQRWHKDRRSVSGSDWSYPSVASEPLAIDWNCDGVISSSFSRNLSGDGGDFNLPGEICDGRNNDPSADAIVDEGCDWSNDDEVLISMNEWDRIPRPTDCLHLYKTKDGEIDEGCRDTDRDGIADAVDLCPATPDRDQFDSNGDGVGDACDLPPPPAKVTAVEQQNGNDVSWGFVDRRDHRLSRLSSAPLGWKEGRENLSVVTESTPVPEPSMGLLLAAGCMLLAAFARRRDPGRA